MDNPLIVIARKLALLKKPDPIKTGILPLDSIHKATIFLDNDDADADPARRVLLQFFKPYGTELRFICPQKWELNWYGRIKKAHKRKGENPEDIDDDLFLSLAKEDNFAAYYEARYSHAKFKVGIYPSDLYDLVVICRDEGLQRQTDYLKTIKEMLLKIR